MNIKGRPSTSPNPYFNSDKTIMILKRETDSHGRTLYQVNWLHDNNRITWEPLIKLKQYYRIVREYESNSMKKNEDPELQAMGDENDHYVFGEREMIERREEELERMADWGKKQEEREERAVVNLESEQKVEEDMEIEIIQEDREIEAGKPETIEQQAINQQQPKTGQNPSAPSSQSAQPSTETNCDFILRRVIRATDFKVTRRRNPKPRYEETVEELKVWRILNIFKKDGVDLAEVVLMNGKKQVVLRDVLRIVAPELLAGYYQELIVEWGLSKYL